uniref:tetratricopeptide repeat protein n=1 Tax=Lentibacter sp. TaxID=2024994 RepID=UPI003F6A0FA6
GVLAHVQILSQLGRTSDAAEMLKARFGETQDPEIVQMRTRLDAGEILPFDLITSPQDGLAEVNFTIAGALAAEPRGTDTLLFARVAQHLRPEMVDASLLLAQLLEDQGQLDAAVAAYRSVPSDHPAFHVAEMGRAEALRAADKMDAALEVMEKLSISHANLPVVHSAMGDLLRGADRFEDAQRAYDRSLALWDGRENTDWRTLYTRGIVHERLGNWDKAEADFRAALVISPGEPNVLNYLGYSLVEQRRKLDEALEMIEQAVAARPQSGYIIDSLGWALFRLGRYDEAVPHMERAAELMSIDPVVNDHLGDVYWAVGRKLEAQFQWKRALSFIDYGEVSQDADPERIRRKLEIGLDRVLEEEGAKPLELVNDDS